jgi:hypothetical protein
MQQLGSHRACLRGRNRPRSRVFQTYSSARYADQSDSGAQAGLGRMYTLYTYPLAYAPFKAALVSFSGTKYFQTNSCSYAGAVARDCTAETVAVQLGATP